MKDNVFKLNIIKYVSYICFACICFFTRDIGFPDKFFITFVILVHFINSQFRVNYLENKKNSFFLSLTAEITGVTILIFNGFEYTVPFLLIPAAIDIGFFLPQKLSVLIFTGIPLLYLSGQMIAFGSATPTNVVNIFFLFSVFLLSMFLSATDSKKKEAQNFYDKMRITEEELLKINEELESYSRTIEELTLLRERNRLSRELHDGVGHTLSTLIIQLQAIKSIMKKNTKLAEEMMEEVIPYSKNSLENVRRTVRELKPRELEAFEGVFAIEELISNFRKFTGVDVRLILSKEKYSLSSDHSSNLYRIVQECLSNSIRHGEARNIIINIQFLEDKLYMRIKDDGKGCVEIIPSFGLISIGDRVKEMNGQFSFISTKGRGFEVSVTLPRYKDSGESTELSETEGE